MYLLKKIYDCFKRGGVVMKSESFNEEEIYHVFQPIYDIQTSSISGFEGLLRSKKEPNTEVIFKKAEITGKLSELDIFSIKKAINSYYSTNKSSETVNLFLNIYPSTILRSNISSFVNSIDSLNIPKERVVFELSENEFIIDFHLLQSRIYELKKFGFQVAIDDFGKGYANLKRIIELEPDIVKLDRYFATDLQTSKKKQAMIELLIEFFNKNDCKMILEGIETEEVLSVAKKLGIKYAQGFHLGRPSELSKYVQLHSDVK